jgi:hypothetical protein
MKKGYIIAVLSVFFLLSGAISLQAQDPDEDLIQFSGVVITGDSLSPVPFTNVLIENTSKGTMTDYYGYFSFVAQKGDSILFSSIGYERARFIIPDTLTTNRYSLIQILDKDTINLRETVIYPWPTREQFKQAFLEMEVPETDFDRAMRNLAQADMIARSDAAMPGGGETFKYSMQQYQQQIYYAGQAPPINVLNPVAWSQFIKAWKRGDFNSDRKRGGQ